MEIVAVGAVCILVGYLYGFASGQAFGLQKALEEKEHVR